MKKIVGIIPSTLGFDTDNPFDDKYYVQNSYIERIKLADGIPIIIPPVNLNVNYEALQLCDAFLIIGGAYIWRYHFDVIDYAIKHDKKLLGICMGMQAIGMYSNNDLDENTLERINNHSNKELLVHKIKLNKDSKLAQIFGTELMVNSVHNYVLKYVTEPFKIVGTSSDGVIEAVEYKNIIGVQFHPELMKKTDLLFEWLVS